MEFKEGDVVRIFVDMDDYLGTVHAVDDHVNGVLVGVEVDFGSDICKCCGTQLPENIRLLWADPQQLIMVQPVEFEGPEDL